MSVITSGNINLNSVSDMVDATNALSDAQDELQANQSVTDAQVAQTATQVEKYKTYINIDESVPSITLGKSLDTKLVLESQRLAFYTDGNKAASLANDELDAPSAAVTNLYMKTTDATTGKDIGNLGWIARSNGHLSLKVVR